MKEHVTARTRECAVRPLDAFFVVDLHHEAYYAQRVSALEQRQMHCLCGMFFITYVTPRQYNFSFGNLAPNLR